MMYEQRANFKEDCSKRVVFGGVRSSTAIAQPGCVVAAIVQQCAGPIVQFVAAQMKSQDFQVI